MAALGEMAEGVAHEINNPLAIITLNLDKLKRDLLSETLDREELKKNLLKFETSVSRIAKIIRGLRDFTKKANEEALESTSLREIVNITLSFCQERFKSEGVEFLLDIQETSFIMCRPTEISQILLNLFNNAFDAAKVSRPDDSGTRWVKIQLAQGDQKIVLTVEDSGKGVPADIQEKIFQPFFTTKDVGKGTGLGLSISKGLAESNGAQLELDTQSKHGKFVLSFPSFSAT
jgi:C4-dicarboxylate-specific signal transduction histidine kinase